MEEGGELTFVVAEPQMRFAGLRNNDLVNTDHSGYVRERVALGTLVRNKWFEVDGSVGELRIRLGERAKKVREGTAPASNEANGAKPIHYLSGDRRTGAPRARLRIAGIRSTSTVPRLACAPSQTACR